MFHLQASKAKKVGLLLVAFAVAGMLVACKRSNKDLASDIGINHDDSARKTLSKRAESNDGEAAWLMAQIDPAYSLSWMKRAAAAGYAGAKEQVALLEAAEAERARVDKERERIAGLEQINKSSKFFVDNCSAFTLALADPNLSNLNTMYQETNPDETRRNQYHLANALRDKKNQECAGVTAKGIHESELALAKAYNRILDADKYADGAYYLKLENYWLERSAADGNQEAPKILTANREEALRMLTAERAALAAAEQARVAAAACFDSGTCMNEKYKSKAVYSCEKAVERRAKNSFRWREEASGWFGPLRRWDKYADHPSQSGILTIFGDQIEFQNGFGAWTRVNYSCDYNVRENTLVSVSVE